MSRTAQPTKIERLATGIARHWLALANLALAIYALLPVLAPVLMRTGLARAAAVIYWLYRSQCHQLPQRSFFLFGAKLTYSLEEIQAAWRVTNDSAVLRQFIGSPEMGWKVAWSDRMVAMYLSALAVGLAYWPLRRRLRPLSLRHCALMVLPLVVDGVTHLLSDLFGIGKGFRDTNTWLAVLTAHALPARFYVGDALGSFNSSARLFTGIVFGVAGVWFVYPRLAAAFSPGHTLMTSALNRHPERREICASRTGLRLRRPLQLPEEPFDVGGREWTDADETHGAIAVDEV